MGFFGLLLVSATTLTMSMSLWSDTFTSPRCTCQSHLGWFLFIFSSIESTTGILWLHPFLIPCRWLVLISLNILVLDAFIFTHVVSSLPKLWFIKHALSYGCPIIFFVHLKGIRNIFQLYIILLVYGSLWIWVGLNGHFLLKPLDLSRSQWSFSV